MNRPVRTGTPVRVTSRTSTTPRLMITSSRRSARIAAMERLNTLAGVDDGLDAIALHLGRAAVARPSSRATGRQKLYQTLSKGLLDLS